MSDAPTTSKAPAQAPRERDRLFTTMRAAAVAALMVVHWGLAVTFSTGLSQTGIDRFTNVPAWFTWLFVWIGPVWFGMFGALNLHGVRKATKQGQVGAFYRKRLTRLLIPFWVYAGVFVVIEASLRIGGVGQCAANYVPGASTENFLFYLDEPWKWLTWLNPYPHFDCLGLGQAPFWFMLVYILLTFMFPLMVKMYDMKGAPRLPFGMQIPWKYTWALLAIGSVFFFDLTRETLFPYSETPLSILLMILQMLVIWGFFGYIGFLYADREYERPLFKRWIWVGFAALTLLTAVMVIGPYPDALWDGTRGNQFPPTAAYLVGGLASVFLMLGARSVIERFSRLRGVNPAVNALEKYNYTIYIWHMAALQIVWWGTRALGWHEGLKVPGVESVDVLFGWSVPASQVLFFLLPWPFLVLIVAIFHRAESWSLPSLRRGSASSPASSPPPSAAQPAPSTADTGRR